MARYIGILRTTRLLRKMYNSRLPSFPPGVPFESIPSYRPYHSYLRNPGQIREISHKLAYQPEPFFYAIGNTPAVCLTQHLAPEEPAAALLLGCGDPRSILFTNYSRGNNVTSDLDFTCCDTDPAILARNVLFLTLLSGDVTGSKNLLIWNVFYHLYLDQASLSLLLVQCRKLADLSESVERWNSGPYGSFLRMCTRRTLNELRHHWKAYINLCQLTNNQREHVKGAFAAGMERIRVKTTGGIVFGGALSAGPLFQQACSAIPEEFTHYWKTGITSTSMKDITDATLPNPTLCRSVSNGALALHYATDPLQGYHLSAAFAPLKSTPNPMQGSRGGFGHAVDAAQRELAQWAKALRDTLASRRCKIVIRFFSGDAMDFCRELANCGGSMSTETRYFTRPWEAHPLVLDGNDYNQSAVSKAPVVFNIIDTSNLADHLGVLTLLIHTRPLLVHSPSSTLYTESTLDGSDTPRKQFLERICGDAPTISLLFGLLPWTCATNFNTHSNTHEVFLALSLAEAGGFSARFRERMAWKLISLGDPAAVGSSMPQKCDPLQLARLLFNVYQNMFQPEEDRREIGLMIYTRGTFALLLRLVKGHVQTDWKQFMGSLLGFIEKDATLILGLNNYQEFLAQLHIAGVMTHDIFLNYPEVLGKFGIRPSVGIFEGWKKIPPLVCILFSVPRSSVKRLQELAPQGSLFFHCDAHSPQILNRYSCIHPVFGIVKKKSDGRIFIQSDPRGWAGDSPLVLSFLVPSWTLMTEPRNLSISLGVHPVALVTVLLIPALGYNQHVFSTKLLGKSVYLSPEWPNIPIPLNPERTKASSPNRTTSAQSTGRLVDVNPISMNLDKSCKKVETLTSRVDIIGEIPKRELVGGAVVTARQASPCTLLLKFGTLEQSLAFPFPINGAEAEIHIARGSSYIEVTAPISNPLDGGASGFPTKKFPVFSKDKQPKCWNMPYLNMDRLPALDISKSPKLDWLSSHIALTFSGRELVIRKKRAHMGEDWLVDTKESIGQIITYFSGLHGLTKRATFALQGPDGITSVVIFATDLRLDLGSHTVVMDCCVMPLSVSIASDALGAALLDLSAAGMHTVETSAKGLAAWRELLPASVERCRTWKHSATTCEYKTNGIPANADPNESPLCSCAAGNSSPEFQKNPSWRPFAKYVTRAALSPLFAVPYLEP